MPTSLAGAAAFVLGFWLALQLLLPLVVPVRDATLGAVLDANAVQAQIDRERARSADAD